MTALRSATLSEFAEKDSIASEDTKNRYHQKREREGEDDVSDDLFLWNCLPHRVGHESKPDDERSEDEVSDNVYWLDVVKILFRTHAPVTLYARKGSYQMAFEFFALFVSQKRGVICMGFSSSAKRVCLDIPVC